MIVTDNKSGAQIADLKDSDFEVIEDGKPQKIESFRFIKLDGGVSAAIKEPPREIRTDNDEEMEAAREDVRLFAIFLDDYHVRRGTSMAVRNQLAQFVDTQLGPSDMIGVMYPLVSTSSVRMTRNHSAVVRGLQQFTGRKYEYEPKNQFEENYAHYPTEIVERIRNQVSLSALRSLVVHMGSLKEGRKALILVSEGYSNLPPPQMRNANAQLPGLGNPNAYNPDAGVNDLNEDRAQWAAGLDMDSDLREVYDNANRNNVAIYAVDPRGLPGFEFDINEGVGMRTDCEVPHVDDGYAADAGGEYRRQSHRQPQRHRGGDEADYARLERLLSDRLQLVAGAVRRQVPRDQGAREAARHSGARPQRLLGVDRGADGARAGAAETAGAQAGRSRDYRRGEPPEQGERRADVDWELTRRERQDARDLRLGTDRPDHRAIASASEEPARVSLMAVGPDGSPYFRGKIEGAAPPATNGGAASPSRAEIAVAGDIRRRARQDAVARVGRRRRVAGARHRGPRNRRPRPDRRRDAPRHAGDLPRAHGSRVEADQSGSRSDPARRARVQSNGSPGGAHPRVRAGRRTDA